MRLFALTRLRPPIASIAVLYVVVLQLGTATGGALAAPAAAVLAVAKPMTVPPQRPVVIAGRITGLVPGAAAVPLELERESSQGTFVVIAKTVAALDGHYRFGALRLSRTLRLRVLAATLGSSSPAFRVTVRPVVPSSAGVRRAARYLAAREGTTAFAVIDDYGRVSGLNIHRRFHSASTVKAMLLVAYLRKLAQSREGLGASARRLLYPMIHSSDNSAASAVLDDVGESGLGEVARAADMGDYVSGGATWGFTEVSASDLAHLFSNLERLLPRRFDGYARWLLADIEPAESWGIPAVARPRFRVLFKGGWLPELEGLVNQAARLETRGTVFALAVLTRADPSMTYGERTIEGVTRELLAGAL
jgi:Beta-lactamase enzyme family